MIEQAVEEDIPQMVKLINSAYRGDESRKGWTTEADLLDGQRTDDASLEKLLKKPHVTILKYSDAGEIHGLVYLERFVDKLYLGMLSVSPLLQDKGIGKKLLIASEDYARELCCDSIEMTVISVRKELIEWYQRRGYEFTGEKRPFPSEMIQFVKQPIEFLVLEKKLNKD